MHAKQRSRNLACIKGNSRQSNGLSSASIERGNQRSSTAVAASIDGSPFIAFSLKAVDLANALKERGIVIGREAEAMLPTVDGLLPS